MNEQIRINLRMASNTIAYLEYMQNTNAVDIRAKIEDYNLTGCTAQFYVKKPSGNVIYNSAEIDGDVVVIHPTMQMFSESGKQFGIVQIMAGKKVGASYPIAIEVKTNFIDDSAVESSNEFTALQTALQTVNKYDNRIMAVEKGLSDETRSIRGQIHTNLLNPTAQTQTINGITFTNNGDGTYTANGTASQDTIWLLTGGNMVDGDMELDATKTYKLLSSRGGSGSTYQIIAKCWKTDGTVLWFQDWRNPIITGVARCTIYIAISSGYTVNNLVFKPMLTTDLSATYDDFVPYTGDSGRLNEDVANLISGISEKISTDHNSIYQKKDITAWFRSGELWERIANDFDGIYPGQYFDCGKTITAKGSSETGTSIILIAGCNVHLNTNSGMRYNHITCVPVTHFGTAHMNPSNTTEGAYFGSDMNQSIIGGVATSGGGNTINSQLFGVFGSHLKTSTEVLSTSIDANGYNRFGGNSGCSKDRNWHPVQAVLMSEIEVYGSIVWSSSGIDTGSAKVQMPAFRYNTNDMIPNDVDYFLKDVASSERFCTASSSGYADFGSASNILHVRPRFILGK